MPNKETAKDIARKYADEVRKIVNPSAVILFGSYVNGVPDKWSDIDIAVLVKNYEGNWIDTRAMLYGLKWNDNFTDVEPHLLDEEHDPSGFVKHIIKTGEVVYLAQTDLNSFVV
ncbi:MAG: nucleotidyltransferase domain-containing protein [Defluviitaleaceae bacterium]|nr:nucleotidyltransferase domain-containing protein [Defluviitaleaceae bacterium]MCL2263465.1 nucleotidyltransferase domain-containing protein [Defluviitaleaceae bacterium]